MWRHLARQSSPVANHIPQRFSAAFIPRQSVAWVATARMLSRDPNTLSNYTEWRTKHITTKFAIDFDAKCLRGSVALELTPEPGDKTGELVLDTSHLAISSVKVDGRPAEWTLRDRVEP